MEGLLPVQQKISCIFEITVQNEPSNKRGHQPYKVLAGDKLNPKIQTGELDRALITEKLDGTCVLIDYFEGKPWLWARLDRKPNKNAEKRFKKFQSQNQFNEKISEKDKPKFGWDVTKDFKEVPEYWKPALGVEIKDGHAMPDSIGHTPGWVPVDIKSRQYCWHLSSVDLISGAALVLRESEDGELVIDIINLQELAGKTAELIGTMVNGNPYKLGTKQHPIHVLVVHGSLRLDNIPPQLDRLELTEWFNNNINGRIEGIVWHCPSGSLYKLHRNHLGLKWPVEDLLLSNKPVKISNNITTYELSDGDNKTLFYHFSRNSGKVCDKLQNIHELFFVKDKENS